MSWGTCGTRLFLTDPFEASIPASAQGQQVIAKALAEAIEQYLAG